jgi:hypothetical protein
MLLFDSISQRSLSRCQARNGHSVGRATYIVQTSPVEEFNRRRVTTVFTANSHFNARTGQPPLLHRHLYQLTYTVLVKSAKWVVLIDPHFDVIGQKFSGIVA